MKIVILYSGGLDSAVMSKFAEAYYPEAEIIRVWYDIGQAYADKERKSLPSNVLQLRLDWPTIKDDTRSRGGNCKSGPIMIPGRNLVLVTAAACTFLPEEVWLGALAGETHARATDKNFEFLEHVNTTLRYVLSSFSQGTKLVFPLAHLSKLGTVKLALDLGFTQDDLRHTSSCLSGESGNCGKCIVCFRRFCIFHQLGFTESYNVNPLTVADNWEVVKEMLKGDKSYYDANRREEILPAFPQGFWEDGVARYT